MSLRYALCGMAVVLLIALAACSNAPSPSAAPSTVQSVPGPVRTRALDHPNPCAVIDVAGLQARTGAAAPHDSGGRKSVTYAVCYKEFYDRLDVTFKEAIGWHAEVTRYLDHETMLKYGDCKVAFGLVEWAKDGLLDTTGFFEVEGGHGLTGKTSFAPPMVVHEGYVCIGNYQLSLVFTNVPNMNVQEVKTLLVAMTHRLLQT